MKGPGPLLTSTRGTNGVFGKIAWHEYSDGKGSFLRQKVVDTVAIDATSVYTADVDGDGDVDVLSATFRDDKITWHEHSPVFQSAAGDANRDF